MISYGPNNRTDLKRLSCSECKDVPLKTHVVFLRGSEADDGVDDGGGVDGGQTVDDGYGNGILLTVITDET